MAFNPLSQVDKLSQHPQRQPPPNHWSWYQSVRLPGPPGPPPPTRPIHGGSSPSQVPPGLSQPGRRYGNSQPNTRSPTSSMLQNTGFPSAQVSECRHRDDEISVTSAKDANAAVVLRAHLGTPLAITPCRCRLIGFFKTWTLLPTFSI